MARAYADSGDHAAPKCLIIACGALAKEIVFLKKMLGPAGQTIDLQCLPADYHNRPGNIIPGLERVLAEKGAAYDRILIGYGDCGTGGRLDAFIEENNLERLPGAHCYAFYAGLEEFDDLMEEEIGSFFLTDYLVKFFDRLIIKGFGIEKHPDLKQIYFANYKRLVYLAQTEDAKLQQQAQDAARQLELEYVYKYVGYGELTAAMTALPDKVSSAGASHVRG